MIEPGWTSFVNGGLGATVAIVVREWWSDRKEARAVEAESKARGETVSLLKDSINLLRIDLKDREEKDRKTTDVLTRFAVAIESLVQNWRSSSAEFKLVRGDLQAVLKKNGEPEAAS